MSVLALTRNICFFSIFIIIALKVLNILQYSFFFILEKHKRSPDTNDPGLIFSKSTTFVIEQ